MADGKSYKDGKSRFLYRLTLLYQVTYLLILVFTKSYSAVFGIRSEGAHYTEHWEPPVMVSPGALDMRNGFVFNHFYSHSLYMMVKKFRRKSKVS